MAIPINVEELVKGGVVESTRIEFKEGFNPERIVHAICAFANDIDNIGGAYIVIGVSEKDSVPQLPPKGIPTGEVNGILKKLQGFCHRIEPLYEPVAEPMTLQGKTVIVLWCPAGFGRPYNASKSVYHDTSDKRYYIRKFSSTTFASPEEERELFYASSDIPFDDRPNLAASVDDLSPALMRDHLRQIGSALYAQSAEVSLLELAEDLQLASGPPEDLRPRNVGILMFSDHVERYFRYARIDIVEMPDPTGQNMVEQVFTGPIQRQLVDALAFLKKREIRSLTAKDANRAEASTVYNYPYAAVEEILSNAVYHRSYQIPEPITVRITPQAMEITSPQGSIGASPMPTSRADTSERVSTATGALATSSRSCTSSRAETQGSRPHSPHSKRTARRCQSSRWTITAGISPSSSPFTPRSRRERAGKPPTGQNSSSYP